MAKTFARITTPRTRSPRCKSYDNATRLICSFLHHGKVGMFENQLARRSEKDVLDVRGLARLVSRLCEQDLAARPGERFRIINRRLCELRVIEGGKS